MNFQNNPPLVQSSQVYPQLNNQNTSSNNSSSIGSVFIFLIFLFIGGIIYSKIESYNANIKLNYII